MLFFSGAVQGEVGCEGAGVFHRGALAAGHPVLCPGETGQHRRGLAGLPQGNHTPKRWVGWVGMTLSIKGGYEGQRSKLWTPSSFGHPWDWSLADEMM